VRIGTDLGATVPFRRATGRLDGDALDVCIHGASRGFCSRRPLALRRRQRRGIASYVSPTAQHVASILVHRMPYGGARIVHAAAAAAAVTVRFEVFCM